ncbi:hypothetical protein EV649_2047 [Kribbella sp. VKM Ac-2569]|nr:hypothetical protein EV649_2047 [Kribbella sp. VKM Ac-2569]
MQPGPPKLRYPLILIGTDSEPQLFRRRPYRVERETFSERTCPDGVLYRFDHHWNADFPYDTSYRYNGNAYLYGA